MGTISLSTCSTTNLLWLTTLTEPPSVHYRILPSYGTVCAFGDISSLFSALIRVLPLLSGCRATLASTASALAVTVGSKGDGSRSLFCRIVRSVVSSNSEDTGSFDSRREVGDVDGVNCWGSAKMREILSCAGDCFEGARRVCIVFLFGGGVVVVVQQSLYLEHRHITSVHIHIAYFG